MSLNTYIELETKQKTKNINKDCTNKNVSKIFPEIKIGTKTNKFFIQCFIRISFMIMENILKCMYFMKLFRLNYTSQNLLRIN